jgi:hypothetical protein
VTKCENRDWSEPLEKVRTWSGGDRGTANCSLTGPSSIWHWVEIRNYRRRAVVVSIVGSMDPNPPPGAIFVSDLATAKSDREWDYLIPVAKRPKGWLKRRYTPEMEKFVFLSRTGRGGPQEIKTTILVDLKNGRPPVDFGPLEIVVDT